MHAFLIAGNQEDIKSEIEKLVNNHNFKIYPFPVNNISDVRALNKFTKLKKSEDTAILCENIDKATLPALNALLKNLEEPGNNQYFILTALNSYNILPTILSRCQLIKAKHDGKNDIISDDAENFINASIGGKFQFLSEIKDRQTAVQFLSELIHKYHQDIKNGSNYHKTAHNIRVTQKTIDALKANGNVVLQLTNFLIKLIGI